MNFSIIKFATKLLNLSRGNEKKISQFNVQFRVQKCQACSSVAEHNREACKQNTQLLQATTVQCPVTGETQIKFMY